jgi:hypothetical protein
MTAYIIIICISMLLGIVTAISVYNDSYDIGVAFVAFLVVLGLTFGIGILIVKSLTNEKQTIVTEKKQVINKVENKTINKNWNKIDSISFPEW